STHPRTSHSAGRNTHQFDNTKVRENGFTHGTAACVAFLKQNVSWLDITMQDAVLMGIINGSANGGEETNDLSGRRKLTNVGGLRYVFSQGLPFNIIHNHVGDRTIRLGSIGSLEVIDLNNIRVMERGNSPCFTGKAGQKFRVLLEVCMH